MKKHFLGIALALAALTGLGQVKSTAAVFGADPAAPETAENYKAPLIGKTTPRASVKQIGGLDLVTEYYGGVFGLTPKEYGLRYGTGASRKHKSNRNRYAANASTRKRFNA